MTETVAAMVMMFSVLVPTKMWYAPDQDLTIEVQGDGPVQLMLTTFAGRQVEAEGEVRVEPGATVNLRDVFVQLDTPGTYLLYAVPPDGAVEDFVGTPLVIGVREDRRRAAVGGPIVIKIEPLRYAVMHTEEGELTMAFYYDVAPHTTDNFLRLAEGGFFDGLYFHRIVPGFVIQGGDPRGDGTGGPGYAIQAEFNERPHLEGVLSMARTGDPAEATGAMPRPEFANSAGSQFFVCLDYTTTRQLDRRYTAFGRVVDGMEAVRSIAEAPLADPRTGRPESPPVIQRVEVLTVERDRNPYPQLQNVIEGALPEVPVPGGEGREP
jgi:peptidyl-prolyl cis-trans isomerase B (cyclophilin B)